MKRLTKISKTRINRKASNTLHGSPELLCDCAVRGNLLRVLYTDDVLFTDRPHDEQRENEWERHARRFGAWTAA